MEEDEAPSTSDQEMRDEEVGTDVQEAIPDETHAQENEEEVAPDQAIHEPAVGKGLAGALQLLKDRGTLKETIEWGGRNMDKKKGKLVGIVGDGATKEIHIVRTDEYGRTVSIFLSCSVSIVPSCFARNKHYSFYIEICYSYTLKLTKLFFSAYTKRSFPGIVAQVPWERSWKDETRKENATISGGVEN